MPVRSVTFSACMALVAMSLLAAAGSAEAARSKTPAKPDASTADFDHQGSRHAGCARRAA